MTTSALFEEVMKPKVRSFTVLWAALTMSLFTYLVILHLRLSASAPLPVDQTIHTAVYVAAAVVAFISLILRFTAFSDRRIAAWMKAPLDPSGFGLDTRTGVVDPALKEKMLRLSEKEQRVCVLSANVFKPFVFGMALNEAVALFGLLLAFLYQQPSLMYPFAGAALVLNLPYVRILQSVNERAFKGG